MNDQESPASQGDTATLGKWMIIALWVLLLGFATFFAQKWMDQRERGQTPVDQLNNLGQRSVLLESDRLGHYVVEGLVNGQPVTFLVDTGASGVSIPGSMATRLGLKPGLQYPVSTANGSILVHETRIDTLSIGHLQRENVRASINSSMEGEVGLLGMTYLRHFELIQRHGTLTIREP